MVTRKVTVTLSEELLALLGEAAREDGVPVSRLIAAAATRELRLRAGRQALREWQNAHGALTVEELAMARAEAADADAELLSGLSQRDIA